MDCIAQRRVREFNAGTNSLGIQPKQFDFGDGMLDFQSLETMVKEVLQFVRAHQFAAIFSFHPQEITMQFDHRDHEVAGRIAQHVGEKMDVQGYAPEFPATEFRPDLYLWTTDKYRATHRKRISKKDRKKRNNYAKEFYPSQFHHQNKKRWSRIFDTITKKEKVHQEFWMRVRWNE